jgi:dephospho-CoA kinase
VLLVGLTGGIGSGKSTVSRMMAERGAVVIDADAIAREVVEPGGPAYEGVVERFGSGILSSDGRIDRPALARVVFGDEKALADLNALTHPAIGAVMAERMAAESATDHVVVLDVPLLVESGRNRPDLAALVVVDAPEEVAVGRVVADRGMEPSEVRARLAAQATREQRLARADRVIDNSGSLEELSRQVDEVMAWLEGMRG